MKKLFLLCLIAPLLLAATAHKYYLSVTDLAYNEKAASLQMITRLFYDDLEDVLQERYDSAIIVDATADQAILDRYLKKYMQAKLEITLNGQKQTLNVLGKEYEDDYVVVYSEIEGIQQVKNLMIENTLLMDLFPEQKNMMHTEIYGKKKSFLLENGNAKAVLNFSE